MNYPDYESKDFGPSFSRLKHGTDNYVLKRYSVYKYRVTWTHTYCTLYMCNELPWLRE